MKQERPYTCAVACLRSFILRQTGNFIAESDLAEILRFKEDEGTELIEVEKALYHLGYRTQYMRRQNTWDLKNYLSRNQMVMILWHPKHEFHASLLVAADQDTITLMDPGYDDYRTLSWDEFLPNWFSHHDVRSILRIHHR